MKLYWFVILCLISLSACGPKEESCAFEPDVNETVSLDFEILQDSLTNFNSKDDLVKFLTGHPVVRDHIFRRGEFPSDSVFINDLYARFTNQHIDTLLLEVKRVFGDGAGLKSEFEQAFSNLKYYYPEIRISKASSGRCWGVVFFG